MISAEQQSEWLKQRARLEREARVLVVDSDRSASKRFDDLLYRARIPSRSVASGEQALKLVGREHYALMLCAQQLSDMTGIQLVEAVRRDHPGVDVMLSLSEPTAGTLARAFELGVVGMLEASDSDEDVSERLRAAVGKHVDRGMRATVLGQLRGQLDGLDAERRLEATNALDHRLNAYKATIGACERVLVIEHAESELRPFSEHLLLEGLRVEIAENISEAVTRLADKGVFVVIVDVTHDAEHLETVLEHLHAADPDVDIALSAREPDAATMLAAHDAEVRLFTPWPPMSMGRLVRRVREQLKSSRRQRLVDNLFAELFRETHRDASGALPGPDDETFVAFRDVIGLQRVLFAESASLTNGVSAKGGGGLQRTRTAEQLDQVLSDAIADADEPKRGGPAAADAEAGSDRREHTRIPESQFVRFRALEAPASKLAYIGDLSEGGIFIRTPDLLASGTGVEVEFNAQFEGNAFVVRCQARVAWVARDEQASSLGPGFGVRFIDPPTDVVNLLKRIVASRAAHPAAKADTGK